MDNFSKLPEECISQILSMTSPRDACRLSAISSLFNAAADSNSLWESFLPSDYREIVSRSVSPVVFSTKKQLYFSLCESPPLLDSGRLVINRDLPSFLGYEAKILLVLPSRWEVVSVSLSPETPHFKPGRAMPSLPSPLHAILLRPAIRLCLLKGFHRSTDDVAVI
ncbi:hypothetical protein Vadar_011307 [Vaccinium darrowii]|uniref:Uncharacterized protein n=1 Tax=Vaccinium darrowii TaxID=229202 RepID=A0ACB7WZV5_9ERIC|nr:hypothetical protein Vadar_011307 [Vaccinium darrowii]